MKKIIILIIIILGFCMNISSQDKSRREVRGDKQYNVFLFDKAIKTYTRVKQLSVDGKRKLAESYHNIGDNKSAETIYADLIKTNSGIKAEDHYNYSMVLKMNGKYAASDKSMETFFQMKPDDLRGKDFVSKRNSFPILQNDNGTFKISYLNFNSKTHQDFGAAYYHDKIVFVSSRTKKAMIVRKDNWTGNSFLDMYVADIKGGQFDNVKQFDKTLNRKRHEGPASFSNNFNQIAFTRNDYKGKIRKNEVNLQIFFSQYSNNKWSEPEAFYLNSKDYSVGHPCLTSDGRKMYFASDMPGGFGGVDLYVISKNNSGVWENPINLGSMINTEGDEMFPFYEETNNILFFSSDGRFGLGGLDVFYSQVSNSIFGEAKNAGSPINGQFNDYAFVSDNKLSAGYFSSDRDGTDGLYSVSILKNIKEETTIKPDVVFTVTSPLNIANLRSVKETFPIRNYVFFDLESSKIPERYVLLTKKQAKEFQITNLEMMVQKDFSGRSKRQLIVYYNILNILGNRMVINPTAMITLVGSSEKGPEDGVVMAELVKKYLVDIFEIADSRIAIEGRDAPKIPSGQLDPVNDIDMKKEGNRRVTIESKSPLLIMEFHSGPGAPLKPIEIVVQPEVPFDSYVSFNLEGAISELSNWSMEMTDEKGKMQKFGPYTQELVSIPGKNILGNNEKGVYHVKMIGQSKNGLTIEKDTTVNVVLWKSTNAVEGMRFSILYEFDESESILMYHKYIKEVVVPLIPIGATVIIRGHTDVIGDEVYNTKLSLNRAKDVKMIMSKVLDDNKRRDVIFLVHAFGEDSEKSPFGNKLPEERFYNRTVIIEIIPK
jgi:outer membrane protein OmpA-like peptidoglycan-associated protein/tetratricopeptide (TPR) repeat protein